MVNRYMQAALREAEQAAGLCEIPVGAVVVRAGEIISTGRNRREKEKNALSHAEIEAVDKACRRLGDWRLDGCDIYVTLEPCSMCAGAILNARLSRIFFGAYDYKAGACGSAFNLFAQPLGFHPEIIGGMMERECLALLTDFFKKLR